jgi:hypothetical protein
VVGDVDSVLLAVGLVEVEGEVLGEGLAEGLGAGDFVVGPGSGVGWPFVGGVVCPLPLGLGVGLDQSSTGPVVADLEGLGVLVGLGAVVGESRTLGSLGLVITTAGRSWAPGVLATVPLLATANAVPTPPAATIAVRPVRASTRRVPRLPTRVSTKSYRTDRSAPDASRRAACQKFTCFPSSAYPWGGDGPTLSWWCGGPVV